MNLIPEQYKKAFTYEKIRTVILYFGLRSALIMGVGLTLLLPSYFFLTLEVRSLDRLVGLLNESPRILELKELEKKVESNNALMRQVAYGITPDRLPSEVIFDIVDSTVSGISYTHFTYSILEDKISIRGKAIRREEFVKFLEILEDEPIVAKVNSPVTNLLHEINFDFTISVELTKKL